MVALAARLGTRIYLGFRHGVHEPDVAECLGRGGEMNRLMNDVPVEPGDVFLIRPGLAPAIGASATMLEVQRVRPHRRTVTYRFWDWNRRYDETGRLDPSGRPRPLHVGEALTTTDWSGPRGESLVAAGHARRSATGRSSAASKIARITVKRDWKAARAWLISRLQARA